MDENFLRRVMTKIIQMFNTPTFSFSLNILRVLPVEKNISHRLKRVCLSKINEKG